MDWTLISFWSLALLLIVVNAGSLVLNLLLLPGNWLMVASLTIYLLGTSFERGPSEHRGKPERSPVNRFREQPPSSTESAP